MSKRKIIISVVVSIIPLLVFVGLFEGVLLKEVASGDTIHFCPDATIAETPILRDMTLKQFFWTPLPKSVDWVYTLYVDEKEQEVPEGKKLKKVLKKYDYDKVKLEGSGYTLVFASADGFVAKPDRMYITQVEVHGSPFKLDEFTDSSSLESIGMTWGMSGLRCADSLTFPITMRHSNGSVTFTREGKSIGLDYKIPSTLTAEQTTYTLTSDDLNSCMLLRIPRIKSMDVVVSNRLTLKKYLKSDMFKQSNASTVIRQGEEKRSVEKVESGDVGNEVIVTSDYGTIRFGSSIAKPALQLQCTECELKGVEWKFGKLKSTSPIKEFKKKYGRGRLYSDGVDTNLNYFVLNECKMSIQTGAETPTLKIKFPGEWTQEYYEEQMKECREE